MKNLIEFIKQILLILQKATAIIRSKNGILIHKDAVKNMFDVLDNLFLNSHSHVTKSSA